MNTVTSELGKVRWLPSMNTMSPGSRAANADRSPTSNGWRITSSHTPSTNARGFGSMLTSRVDRLWSFTARLANRVLSPDPISRYVFGLCLATKWYSRAVSMVFTGPPSHPATPAGRARSGG